MAEVTGEHVHRHPPQRAAHAAGDSNRGAGRSGARVTVGVAAGDDANPHRLFGNEQATVADALARGNLLHGDDAAFQRHGCLQAKFVSQCVGKGAAAVKHDARPHPVAMAFGVTQDGGRIAQADRSTPDPGQQTKTRQLPVHAQRIVGVGKVGHQAEIEAGDFFQTGPCLRQGALIKAQAVHAAVDFQVQIERVLGRAMRCQHVDLFDAMHCGMQIMRHHLAGIGCAEDPFEQKQGVTESGSPQSHGIFTFEQCKAVGLTA